MEIERMIEIERNVMEILEARRKEKKVTLDALGKALYPNDSSPYMRIQSLRKPMANGRTRRLPLGDFMALCEALELDYVRVLFEGAEKIHASKAE